MKADELLKHLVHNATKETSDIPDTLRLHMTEYADDYDIERRNAASIAYAFIKYMLEIPDISDREELKKAEKLCDLYDCRVCVNAITQIYARGIMKALYELDSGRLMFGGREKFTDEEAEEIVNRISSLIEPE